MSQRTKELKLLSTPPSTGNVDLDNFLRSVKRHIDDALRPADGWRLSDLSADVSEVISDKRDLIDIVTAYDDINALKDSVDLILADFAEAIADSKAVGNQYEDHAEVFSHTMEWWNQNRKIIEDAAAAMAATLQASDYADAAEASAVRAGNHEDGASQARDAAVTAKNETQATATQVATQVEAAATHAGNAQTSAEAAELARSQAGGYNGAAGRSATAAATSAGEAAASAGAASDAADRAEGVVDTVQWQGDQLSVMGKVSPPLTGDDGATPYIGPNGTWWVGDTDTGVRAQGEQGPAGSGTGDVLWSELTPALDGKAPVSHTHTVSQVTGLQSALDGKASVSHGHTIGEVTGLEDALTAAGTAEHTHSQSEVDGLEAALDGKAPVSHTHTASQISDATATGRSVLTASSQSAARTAIGAGTSNLALGTTSSTAAAGNHTHTAADVGAAPASHTHTAEDISDATATGRSVLTASSQANARTAIGAGTSNLALGTSSTTAAAGNHTHTPESIGAAPATHTHTASQISNASVVGRAVLTASSQITARQAIGAGTSSLALGTSSSTAAAGDHTHSEYAEVSRVEALEGNAPIIVSSLPSSPLPGRIYLVTG